MKKRTLSILLAVVMMLNITTISTTVPTTTAVYYSEANNEKITPELLQIMENASGNDIINILLTTNAPNFTDTFIENYIKEHTEEFEKYFNQFNNGYIDINQAARLFTVPRVMGEFQNAFIEAHVNPERKILHSGGFTSSIIIEATVAEILYFAELSEVLDISWCDDSIHLDTLLLDILPVPRSYTINDVLNILKHLAGIHSLTDEQIAGYGFINETLAIDHVLEILKVLAGITRIIFR
jgi:hypothetical protein